jgi:hypothetical protein
MCYVLTLDEKIVFKNSVIYNGIFSIQISEYFVISKGIVPRYTAENSEIHS